MCSCNVQWILIWTLSGDVENSRNQGGSEQAHTYTTRVESLEGSGWWHRKILNFLPEAQWIYIYTRNNSYGKRPENWINRVSTTNGKRTALRQVEEAETQSCKKKKPDPSWWFTTSRCHKGMDCSFWSIRVPHQAPEPLEPAQEIWAPQTARLEN